MMQTNEQKTKMQVQGTKLQDDQDAPIPDGLAMFLMPFIHMDSHVSIADDNLDRGYSRRLSLQPWSP